VFYNSCLKTFGSHLVYTIVALPDDGRNYRPENVAVKVINKVTENNW
jgi:hypothetical protein